MAYLNCERAISSSKCVGLGGRRWSVLGEVRHLSRWGCDAAWLQGRLLLGGSPASVAGRQAGRHQGPPCHLATSHALAQDSHPQVSFGAQKIQILATSSSYLLLDSIIQCDSFDFDMYVTPSVSFVEYGGKRKKRQAKKSTLCVEPYSMCIHYIYIYKRINVESQVMLAWERSLWALVQERMNPPFVYTYLFFVFVFFVSLTKTKKKSGCGCMGEL